MFDHFGLLAPFYERLIRPPDVSELCEVLKLPAAGRLLDVGGGTGRVSGQLRNLVNELVICDSSAGMLIQAKGKQLTVYQSHAERLPFAGESFERVLAVDALHHFAHQKDAIADMARVLKTGGRLVIEEPDINHWGVKFVAVAEKIALMRSHFLSPREIEEQLLKHNLQTHIVKDAKYTAWIVAEKISQ
ncbi:MAG: class I SAM-dependent methyltransferase [Candidatus Promineifilaceae bacterium]|jgi:demethylmenaquinone methyltransferase/2-methoxy-6-polyprenyl-1,4-benzoquinol methylase